MATRADRSNAFGAVAEDYDRLRPAPAEAAVDWLVPPGCHVAVDLGAGSGLLTRALTTRVLEVIAVEPDDRMRAVLSVRSPEVRALSGYAESIPLADASADAVFVSSAWHWMDEARAVPEIARVLRPGGRFGVIWTTRDRTEDSAWMYDLEAFRRPGEVRDPRKDTSRRMSHHAVALPDDGSFGDLATGSFSYIAAMTVDDLVDLLGTYSAVITASEAELQHWLDRARAIIARQAPGQATVDLPIRSWCWRADRV
jgi:ubiquinone/menaquinone biosynthesis C-methylase UbiE